MLLKSITTLSFAAACLTAAAGIPAAHAQYAPSEQLITNGPQSDSVEQSGTWSPRQNVVESHHYTRLLEQSRGFREARMREECNPVTDPQLHQRCVQSFAEYSPWDGGAPAFGSSTSTDHYRSNSGD